jgi:hypothetical protein
MQQNKSYPKEKRRPDRGAAWLAVPLMLALFVFPAKSAWGWWDANYQYRRQLTVDECKANYAVLLHFDSTTTPTAATMYASSQSTTPGDDFRIVYNDVTEIDRHIAV